MSKSKKDNTLLGSRESGKSDGTPLPVVELFQELKMLSIDVNNLMQNTWIDLESRKDLLKETGQLPNERLCREQEKILMDLTERKSKLNASIDDIEGVDFEALSLVWQNGTGIAGQLLQDETSELIDIEQQVRAIGDSLKDGTLGTLTDALLSLNARAKDLMQPTSRGDAIQHMEDVHPCLGALRLIRGNDTGDIQQYLPQNFTVEERTRLPNEDALGAYLFWRCDSCEYRVKYFALKSQKASLLTSPLDFTFPNAMPASFPTLTFECTPAFFAMCHMQQEGTHKKSDQQRPERYTCIICVLHPESAKPGKTHIFLDRDDLGRHIGENHFYGLSVPPKLVAESLGIESFEARLPVGQRRFWRATTA